MVLPPSFKVVVLPQLKRKNFFNKYFGFRTNKIYIKVVNPSRNVDAVFINFALTLHIRLAPKIDNGVFRTQVDLLDTEIQMEKGAFPYGWNFFVQDLVKGFILIKIVGSNYKKLVI